MKLMQGTYLIPIIPISQKLPISVENGTLKIRAHTEGHQLFMNILEQFQQATIEAIGWNRFSLLDINGNFIWPKDEPFEWFLKAVTKASHRFVVITTPNVQSHLYVVVKSFSRCEWNPVMFNQ